MITLKQLKRLNILSWIPFVNFFVVNVYMWDKLNRHKVFTTKQVCLSNLRLLTFSIVYGLVRECFIVRLYDFVPDQLFLLAAVVEGAFCLIFPVRFAYYDIKEAYKRQVDNKVKMAVCPICKYEQPEKRDVCWNCGAEMLREADSKTEQTGNCDTCEDDS